MKKTFATLLFTALALAALAQQNFSAAGFYPLPNSGREVYSFNVGWRYHKGHVLGAEQQKFDDKAWPIVNLPHTVELMPAEASGGRNYQGVAWYRKLFLLDKSLEAKKVFLHFEAAMGRAKVYVNGQLVAEHLGGYLPFGIELTGLGISFTERNVVAVMVDNSNDKTYPPGKPQHTLDFAYHGGIYRDAYLVATSPLHITNANYVDKVAGGGVFVQQKNISKKQADISVATDVANEGSRAKSFTVETRLCDSQGALMAKKETKLQLKAGEQRQVQQQLSVKNPALWSPENPYLYQVQSRIIADKKTVDGVMTRVGLRKIEMRGLDGFYLNNEPYPKKLIGVNRHQDYAYVGNAMPNSQHWRDAKKLKDAGVNIVRVAHYPQDPSFMDACDELGMFVIVATPGWQFFPKKDSMFTEHVYSDIRNMIRRDRNHPSVIMWEPVLNETPYPLEFSLKALSIARSEQPGSISAADMFTAGKYSQGVFDNYDVMYSWLQDTAETTKPVFTREFGSNPDDWYAHNSNHRASRSWGERPMVVQAWHLVRAYGEMCSGSRQFLGGAMWHPFDHQRGYHPSPYWGGFMDAFRQPKYSYNVFKSQVSNKTAPMIFIAHELTPFSDPDVLVFTNCDSVRLIAYGRDTLTQKVQRVRGMAQPVVFKNVYDFNDMRRFSYVEKKWEKMFFEAEGYVDGKVVVSEKKMPSRRKTKLQLRIDNEGQSLLADGSDFIPVIAEVTDDLGNVRRLAKENILFTVEGEGEIIGGRAIGANPRAVEWGSAPALIRSTVFPGKIKVTARVLFEGEHTPKSTSIEFESVIPGLVGIYCEIPQDNATAAPNEESGKTHSSQLSDEEKNKNLQEVELQQTDFGKVFK
ncbi:MAG: glycoside hydrolase family 2 [Prevotellaceae bacterium]|jgi:beta-galactosidase|nr:glycoside hydrolase family 2 [Prevotellaceae bacterium]